MKRISDKRRRRETEAKPVRDELIAQVGRCEVCGIRPGQTWLSNLCVHEIANGKNRQKALDKRHAVLVTCIQCNCIEVEDKARYPEARQLAILRKSRPDDFDLVAYNALVNPRAPNRITLEEVDEAAK